MDHEVEAEMKSDQVRLYRLHTILPDSVSISAQIAVCSVIMTAPIIKLKFVK